MQKTKKKLVTQKSKINYSVLIYKQAVYTCLLFKLRSIGNE